MSGSPRQLYGTESESLYVWQTPSTLITKTCDLREILGPRALLREGALFREAYIAGKFAAHLSASSVKLLRPRTQPTPDFAVRTTEDELWFESTEADRPSRKRNLEYTESNSLELTRFLRDDEWVNQSEYAEVIARRCRRKSMKRYDKCDGLIINSNAFGITDEHLIDEDWWQECTRAAHSSFNQVWRFHRSAFAQILVE